MKDSNDQKYSVPNADHGKRENENNKIVVMKFEEMARVLFTSVFTQMQAASPNKLSLISNLYTNRALMSFGRIAMFEIVPI